MESDSTPRYLTITFWVILLLSPVPGLAVYLAWISELDQYGYIFPLYLALIALALFRWDYRLRMPSDSLGISLTLASLGLALFAAYRISPWLSSISFALALTAWLRTHYSANPPTQRLTYLSLLLVMTIRLPLNLDLHLSAFLQRTTSQISSYLLDSYGVTHYLRGNVIELPGGTLFVEEACSGVQSLFTVLFLVCLWMVFRRRPLIASPIYLLAGMAWAIVMNVVRITSVALAQEWYDTDLSTGTPHEILGWICLGIAIVMVLSTDRLLRVMFFPIPTDESGQLPSPLARLWNQLLLVSTPGSPIEDDEPESAEATSSLEQADNRGIIPLTRLLAIGSLVIGIPSLALGYRIISTRFETASTQDDQPLLWSPSEGLMSNTGYAPLITHYETLRNANSRQLGNHADVWTVVIDGVAVRLAISQPYPEWHDMRLCYTGSGWQVNDWKPMIESPSSPENHDEERAPDTLSSEPKTSPPTLDLWKVSYAEMVRDTGEFGTLLFCGFTRDRELLDPPMGGIYSLLDNRVKDRSTLQSHTIMLQLWTETETPLIPEQLDRMQKLFDSFRESVLQRFEAEGSIESPTVAKHWRHADQRGQTR